MDGPSLLKHERKVQSFPIRKMTYFLEGDLTGKKTEELEKLRKVVENDPKMRIDDLPFLSRTEKITRGIQMNHRLFELSKELGLETGDRTLRMFLPMETGLDLHNFVFVPFLKSQTTAEQAEKWVPLAENYAIIGSYSQTELGHGSNVRGLETTATFVPETDEIEIHSPTLTSTKWWPGCLGRTATHTIVMAQLRVPQNGSLKNFGPHAFLVPVRSLEDHKPLPGVEVGDIGPTFYEAVDNGFVRFDKVRIPRTNMFMRFCILEKNGNYIKPPHDKLSYAGMVAVRAGIILRAGDFLSMAATVATRYSRTMSIRSRTTWRRESSY